MKRSRRRRSIGPRRCAFQSSAQPCCTPRFSLLPEPVSATAPQLAMLVPPSVKFTAPVGALPLTVAVKVTLAPTIEGLAELAMPVAVPDVLTTCDSATLLDAVLPASPEYPATMECVPAVSAPMLQTAVRVFPEPVSATAPQLAMLVPPSVKLRCRPARCP